MLHKGIFLAQFTVLSANRQEAYNYIQTGNSIDRAGRYMFTDPFSDRTNISMALPGRTSLRLFSV